MAALVALFEWHWDRADIPKKRATPKIVLDARECAPITLVIPPRPLPSNCG
ncbi:hypothetical protein [Actinoplanes sp. NPDC049118]|uniref:hypothetical protein n=1 Tax=Actinoplanes sp. NPDC049118 TaxID=3155769 RepID=UPI0033F4F86F